MTISPIAVPLTITTAGPQPTQPSVLRAAVLSAVAAVVPDYTANLPGTLIEDVLSTGMGLLITADQGRVDAINGGSVYSASPYVLNLLGAQAGIAQGLPSNTSVLVVFSGPAGYIIPSGFIVSDGTYQYVLQSGTVIGTNGTSNPAYCVASQSGTWAVLANTVTTVVTSLPPGYTITVNNPDAGTAGGSAESVQSYRARTLQGLQATSQGVVELIKSMIMAVPGVQPRLVSVRQVNSTWEIIVGGGDPYAVAYAIYASTLHFPTLMGSMDASLNVITSLISYPNTYTITYVNPPQQIVTLNVIWNTTLAGFTGVAQVNQLGQSAMLDYINGIAVGQPINLLELNDIFASSVSSVLSSRHLTSLSVTATINGAAVTPAAGTQILVGDPESYFYAAPTGVSVTQG
ncbi:baseplate J/gp47 family protein [Acidithiobacillus sp.]|uniref:baseplate J/gp47 family protein n=1 Tax=Acidithiobacillus sp. TaxID=1872118 RepID=UPI003CFF3AF5